MIKNIVFDMGGVILDFNLKKTVEAEFSPEYHDVIYEHVFGENSVWKTLDEGIYTFDQVIPGILEKIPEEIHEKIAAMVKTRIEVFPDIKEHIDFFETLPEYDIAMYTHKKMKTNAETSLEVLTEILPLFEAQEDYSNDALYEVLKGYVEQKGCKNGYAMWPVRTAVSGKQNTPGGATEIMEILGKEESLARLRKGIELLSK